MATGGKRKGSRRAAPSKRRMGPKVVLLAAGITLAVVAWGYLVYVAIDFGADARGGDSRGWAFLGLAAVGAMACLFLGLILIARLARAIGLTTDPSLRAAPPPATTKLDTPAPSSAGSHRHRAP